MESLILYLSTIPVALAAGKLVTLGEPWAAVGAILAYLVGVSQTWVVMRWAE